MSLAQPAIRKTDSWQHQIDAHHAVQDKLKSGLRGVMLPLGMGSGKSLVTIDLICNSDKKDTILIVCPTSVRGVWRREWARHCAIDYDILVLDKGSVSQRAAKAKQLLARKTGKPRIIVINYESVWRSPFSELVLNNKWDWIVCDESHFIKSNSSKVSKFMGQAGHRSWYKLGLTGTPMPHDPIDIFGQYRFLDPLVFGESWHRFNSTYRTFKFLPGIPQRIPSGHQNMDRFSERLEMIMVQVPDYELDLPPVTHDYITCELCPKARRIYQQLKDDLIAEIDSGVVLAANAMVRVLRLQQATSGYAKEQETNVVENIDDSKQRALEELLLSLPESEPVVVYCFFKWDLERVQQAAANCRRVYGELSGERRDLTEHATMPEGIGVMGVQVKSGGVGIDLTRACYGVYYNTGTISPGDFDQTCARLDRPGQKRPVRFYHLLADKTIDVEVYKARKGRRDVVTTVMNSIKLPADDCPF